jgi:hypothetical protein
VAGIKACPAMLFCGKGFRNRGLAVAIKFCSPYILSIILSGIDTFLRPDGAVNPFCYVQFAAKQKFSIT